MLKCDILHIAWSICLCLFLNNVRKYIEHVAITQLVQEAYSQLEDYAHAQVNVCNSYTIQRELEITCIDWTDNKHNSIATLLICAHTQR